MDETGLNYKLVNRAVRTFLCAACLSGATEIPVGRLGEMANRFRESGCSMFPPKRDFPPARDFGEDA